MQISFSRIECFKKCPYLYKLRYIDKLDTLPSDDPANPLILGSALHKGIETTLDEAITQYYNSYPVITDNHVTEAMKLQYLIPKIKSVLPEGLHEVKFENEDIIGFIDLLVPVEPPIGAFVDGWENGEMVSKIEPAEGEWFDIYDFKYTNNKDHYKESQQLHVYKHYFEKLNPGKKIRRMYFMFVPKSNLRIKYKNKTNPKDETIYEFRNRIIKDLESKKIEFQRVTYDPGKVIDFLETVKQTIECEEFHKEETRLCDFCNFQQFCQNGIDYDIVRKG